MNKDTYPILKELLEKYKNEKNIIIFKSRDEANKYLLDLKKLGGIYGNNAKRNRFN